MYLIETRDKEHLKRDENYSNSLEIFFKMVYREVNKPGTEKISIFNAWTGKVINLKKWSYNKVINFFKNNGIFTGMAIVYSKNYIRSFIIESSNRVTKVYNNSKTENIKFIVDNPKVIGNYIYKCIKITD